MGIEGSVSWPPDNLSTQVLQDHERHVVIGTKKKSHCGDDIDVFTPYTRGRALSSLGGDRPVEPTVRAVRPFFLLPSRFPTRRVGYTPRDCNGLYRGFHSGSQAQQIHPGSMDQPRWGDEPRRLHTDDSMSSWRDIIVTIGIPRSDCNQPLELVVNRDRWLVNRCLLSPRRTVVTEDFSIAKLRFLLLEITGLRPLSGHALNTGRSTVTRTSQKAILLELLSSIHSLTRWSRRDARTSRSRRSRKILMVFWPDQATSVHTRSMAQ